MKLPELRKLERLLIASGIPYQVRHYPESCNIICSGITAAEYPYSRGLELVNEKRICSILTAKDIFELMQQQRGE